MRGVIISTILAIAQSKTSKLKSNDNIRKYEIKSYVNVSNKIAMININNN